jgi:hypothetical protein
LPSVLHASEAGKHMILPRQMLAMLRAFPAVSQNMRNRPRLRCDRVSDTVMVRHDGGVAASHA